MNSLCLNTTSSENFIKFLSFPKIGQWMMRFFLGRTIRVFQELADMFAEADARIGYSVTLERKEMIKFQEMYHLVNYFFLFLSEINDHRYYQLKTTVFGLMNSLESIQTKLTAHPPVEDLSDLSLTMENRIISSKALSREWDNEHEDKIWGDYFTSL